MFGMCRLAEAVNLLCENAGYERRYGKNETANGWATVSAQLADFVENTPVKYISNNGRCSMPDTGISSDIGTTPERTSAVWR